MKQLIVKNALEIGADEDPKPEPKPEQEPDQEREREREPEPAQESSEKTTKTASVVESLRAEVRELKQTLKDKDEYIQFLSENPPYRMSDAGGLPLEKLSTVAKQLQTVKRANEELKKNAQSNAAAIREVWPHLTSIMLRQCKTLP